MPNGLHLLPQFPNVALKRGAGRGVAVRGNLLLPPLLWWLLRLGLIVLVVSLAPLCALRGWLLLHFFAATLLPLLLHWFLQPCLVVLVTGLAPLCSLKGWLLLR